MTKKAALVAAIVENYLYWSDKKFQPSLGLTIAFFLRSLSSVQAQSGTVMIYAATVDLMSSFPATVYRRS